MLESKERMSNIGPLALLKVPQGAGGAKRFADWLMREMKKRPVGAPFNLRYQPPSMTSLPMLETVDAVDLNQHCHRITLNGPADDKSLYETVCRLHEQRLDRRLPLWAFYIIDGLTDSRIALYAKVHHGIIDGRSFVDVATRWFSTDPSDRTVRALWEGLPQKLPSGRPRRSTPTLTQIGAGALDSARSVVSLFKAVARQAQASAKLRPGLPLPFLDAPHVLRTGPKVERILGVCVLPLAQVKAFGKAHDASVNDVLLTTLDMALSQFLADKGHPETSSPLVADMPVALKNPGQGGNKVAVLQFPLGTPGATPLGRLAQIRKHTANVKQHIKDTSASALMTYTAVVHGIPALMELLKIESGPMLANMVISNPFGLMEHRWLAGADLLCTVPLNLLAPGQSLNITAVTYDQGLQICFMGFAAELPDIQVLADMTMTAFERLQNSNGPTYVADAASRKFRAIENKAQPNREKMES